MRRLHSRLVKGTVALVTFFFLADPFCAYCQGEHVKPVGGIQAFIFLGVDCPISQDYVGVLNTMKEKYKDRCLIQGVITGGIAAEELEEFQKDYQVEFPLALDVGGKQTMHFNIHVTPEVVLLDQAGKIRYRGAIDNWYYALGRHRPAATEHFLTNAIDALLAGRPVHPAETEPIGCILTMKH